MAAPDAEVTLLLCQEADRCEEERQWLATVVPGLTVVVDALHSRDTFVAAEGEEAFAAAVQEADYAVVDRKWRTALKHLDAAAAVLERWPGTVENHLLVRMYLLRGVALRRLGEPGWELALRQASAMAWKGEPDPRGLEPEDQLALDTERRKSLAGGGGTLVVDGESELFVDGLPVERRSLDLPAGQHRLTAVEAGRLRTFVATVPVLPAREVTVRPEWGPTDDAAWLVGELSRGVSTLDADPRALALLGDWCARHDAAMLTLAEVVPAVMAGVAPQLSVSAVDPLRPAASAGEAVRTEEGIPATFEAATAEVTEVAPARAVTSWRLRSAYFDPVSRRLSAEPAPVRVADTVDARRFRLSARLGWWHQLEREHATLDARGDFQLDGGWSLLGEAGAVVADRDYNFYADWTGATLLHAAFSTRWTGARPVAPVLGAGLEVQAPLWAGAFAEGGAAIHFDRDWSGEVLGRVGVGLAGPGVNLGYGGGLSLGRRG